MTMVKDPRKNEDYQILLCDREAALGSYEQPVGVPPDKSQLGLWRERMRSFGKTILDASKTVAEMAALRWGQKSAKERKTKGKDFQFSQ
ncbi:hypothetical protein TSUD_363590 [Trifolium subterraneum]|uniref:Uncharacterized protein n=1 Tax=Trifolium subterraneum TaxID=3900 RepID=A0A2Z6MU85_TRISU|nr:hypothetical protein TSUD_363590 [Trifolium subterraneum]